MTDDLKKKLDKMLEDAHKYIDDYYKANGRKPTTTEYGKFLSDNWAKTMSKNIVQEKAFIYLADYKYEHAGEHPPHEEFVAYMDPFIKQYAFEETVKELKNDENFKKMMKECENDPEVKILRSKQS